MILTESLKHPLPNDLCDILKQNIILEKSIMISLPMNLKAIVEVVIEMTRLLDPYSSQSHQPVKWYRSYCLLPKHSLK